MLYFKFLCYNKFIELKIYKIKTNLNKIGMFKNKNKKMKGGEIK